MKLVQIMAFVITGRDNWDKSLQNNQSERFALAMAAEGRTGINPGGRKRTTKSLRQGGGVPFHDKATKQ
ncbi:hypothetical protein ACFFL1_01925 [Samsonia erythrinae]|uniref:hypothetical protein n=1 Tax=Samsonia erythrinae TaxID=160434 RepID=UPI00104F668A|nr:hypothetical protein [Samsonia erythrinae]